MTWAKFGTEYSDELAHAGLSDAAYRTHTEAIGYVYRVEDLKLRIPKNLIRRFAGSEGYELAVKELGEIGFWRDRPLQADRVTADPMQHLEKEKLTVTERGGRWKLAVSTLSKVWTIGLAAGVSPSGLRVSLAWAAHPAGSDQRPSTTPGKEK